MNKFSANRCILPVILLCVAILCTSACAGTVAVRFFSNGELVTVNRAVTDDVPLSEAAVRALVSGPFIEEAAVGITSAIPAGVKINKLRVTNTAAEVDLSAGIISALSESRLTDIFDQFRTTLGDFPSIASISLTSGGKPLAE